jgi:hypothetical protein
MSQPTYATVATFRMDMSRIDEGRHGLYAIVVPGVRKHPGFVSGNWLLDREAGQSVAVITFESRDAAEALRENVRNNAANQAAAGIELIEIRLLEVEASANNPG